MSLDKTSAGDLLDSDHDLVERLIKLWRAGLAILDSEANGYPRDPQRPQDPDYGLGTIGHTAACLLVAQLSEMKVMADALLQVAERPNKTALRRAQALGNRFYAREYAPSAEHGADNRRRFADYDPASKTQLRDRQLP